MSDFEAVRSAAKKSANEAFDQLPNTEPQRSNQAEGLTPLPDEFWIAEKDWLKDELDREPTEEEYEEYVETWEAKIRDLKEEDGLA